MPFVYLFSKQFYCWGETFRLASAKWSCWCAWPSHAISAAQSGDTLTFDIPKQSADLALIAFAEQADRTLLFSFDETNTRTASRLTGEYEVVEALERLLAGTGLAISMGTQGQLSVAENVASSEESIVEKRKSILGRIGAAFVSVLAVGAAVAEDASGPSGDQTADDAVIEEIIVTANKREESLMEVPQSIQYIFGESLEEQGVFALPDVVQLIPSASLPTGTPARIRYSIRALGWLSNDSGIAFYLDDIPLYVVNGGSGDPNIDMFDLESLQVLRGPQGTLYGRGAMGGTMLITTTPPDLNIRRVRLRAGGSTMEEGSDAYNFDVGFSVPLIQDQLALGFTAGKSEYSGLAEDPDLPGKDHDDGDRAYARAKLRWLPSENVSVDAFYMHQEINEGSNAQFYVSVDPPTLASGGGVKGFTEFESDIFGISVDWETPVGTLTSNTSYLTNDEDFLLSFGFLEEGIPNTIGFTEFHDPINTFNQEVRLLSPADSPWEWIVGASYTNGEFEFTDLGESFEPTAFEFRKGVSQVDSEQFAVFGEISRSFMDGLITPLIGLRSYRDDRSAHIVSDGVVELDTDDQFTAVSPRFSLAITPSDQVLVFLNIASGFRSGVFNTPSSVAGLADLGVIAELTLPETTMWSYEIGARLSLADGSVFIEPSIYHSRFKDLHAVGVVFPYEFQVAIDEIESTGAELLVTWDTPMEGLSLTAMGSTNETEPTKLRPGVTFPPGITEGEQLRQVPEWEYRFRAAYKRPLQRSNLSVFGSVSWYKRAGQGALVEGLSSPIIEDLGLRLGISGESWRATLWGKNVTDDNGSPAGIRASRIFDRRDRRSIGVTLEYWN